MFVAVVKPAPAAPTVGKNNAILRITRVSAAGVIPAAVPVGVEIVYAGSGYEVDNDLHLQTLMGPYPQTAVVIESMNSGCCWRRDPAAPAALPPLWPVELASGAHLRHSGRRRGVARNQNGQRRSLRRSPRLCLRGPWRRRRHAARGCVAEGLFYNNAANNNAAFAPPWDIATGAVVVTATK